MIDGSQCSCSEAEPSDFRKVIIKVIETIPGAIVLEQLYRVLECFCQPFSS